jgi:hypothetical protein
LASAGITPDAFLAAIKTDFKPNFGVPKVWLVASDDALVLVHTHPTRGPWKYYRREEINSVRLVSSPITGAKAVQIVEAGGGAIVELPLPKHRGIAEDFRIFLEQAGKYGE